MMNPLYFLYFPIIISPLYHHIILYDLAFFLKVTFNITSRRVVRVSRGSRPVIKKIPFRSGLPSPARSLYTMPPLGLVHYHDMSRWLCDPYGIGSRRCTNFKEPSIKSKPSRMPPSVSSCDGHWHTGTGRWTGVRVRLFEWIDTWSRKKNQKSKFVSLPHPVLAFLSSPPVVSSSGHPRHNATQLRNYTRRDVHFYPSGVASRFPLQKRPFVYPLLSCATSPTFPH